MEKEKFTEKIESTGKTDSPACPIQKIDDNELFIVDEESWNFQDSRRNILNADFEQMNSARDKR